MAKKLNNLGRARTLSNAIQTKRWLVIKIGERDGWRCHYCKNALRPGWGSFRERNGIWEGESATLDHVTPKSRGGVSLLENMVLACRDCNVKKGNLSQEEYMRRLAAAVEKAIDKEKVIE